MKLLSRLIRLPGFVLFYAKEVLLSNFRVAWDVLTPEDKASPAIIAMPLDAQSDMEILILANLISMTPGTLSLDVSTDRKVLYIHAMFVDDEAALVEELKTSIEAKVLNLLR